MVVALTVLISVLALNAPVGHSDMMSSASIEAAAQRNAKVLDALQKVAPTFSEFVRIQNRGRVQSYLEGLAQNADELPRLLAHRDPSLFPIAGIFSEYIRDVEKNYRNGYFEFAWHQLATIRDFCIGCYREQLSKAEIEQALKEQEVKLLVRDRRARVEAARYGVNLAVRGLYDPKRALQFLDKASAVKEVKDFFGEALEGWRKDLNEWAQEPPLANDIPATGLVALASRIAASADKSKRYPADRRAQIKYLRVAALVHKALALSPSGPHRAEAFFLLGSAYESINEPHLWDLDSMYYEACVSERPAQQLRMNCYQRLEHSVAIGFSGSGGVDLPADQLSRLSRLRGIVVEN